jgi:hypothetical protein
MEGLLGTMTSTGGDVKRTCPLPTDAAPVRDVTDWST